MKENQELLADDMAFEEAIEQPQKLSEKALSKLPSAKSGSVKSKKSQKPAWATTEKEQEENKEAEIDDLLEFAYDLDYDKFMEDFEVRQAFAIIQDRVKEIKQDQDWKEKIAEEWNKTAALEDGAQEQPELQPEQRSVYSYKDSKASQGSRISYKSRLASEKSKQKGQKQEWDRTTVASESKKNNVEDRIANQIANDLLKDNSKLRGVHSNQSIKKILEKEAKRQLLLETNGGIFVQPVITKIVERGEMNKADPSNLPYLHKCPAV